MASLRSLALQCFCSGVLFTAAALPPALAQTQPTGVDQTFDRIERLQQEAAARQRAINLARNTAVQLNGGLNVYRPAKCMFETAGAGNQCLISSSDGYQFRFLGGVPGWQQLNIAPSVETEIRISSDGKSVLGVDYNGAPR